MPLVSRIKKMSKSLIQVHRLLRHKKQDTWLSDDSRVPIQINTSLPSVSVLDTRHSLFSTSLWWELFKTATTRNDVTFLLVMENRRIRFDPLQLTCGTLMKTLRMSDWFFPPFQYRIKGSAIHYLFNGLNKCSVTDKATYLNGINDLEHCTKITMNFVTYLIYLRFIVSFGFYCYVSMKISHETFLQSFLHKKQQQT